MKCQSATPGGRMKRGKKSPGKTPCRHFGASFGSSSATKSARNFRLTVAGFGQQLFKRGSASHCQPGLKKYFDQPIPNKQQNKPKRTLPRLNHTSRHRDTPDDN